ncbi:Dihydrofolate reductase [Nakamurella panacisegetis]|uniref:Dihydrofolate reductase n=1 Tax=Nakamurella panacisegetis TaxID=1090615 RepID=A0A1H0S0U5_9ACTN|nr:ACT domain-containing protein [Nakamurella panacisegetis]SDP34886.1 Dihydrofolate reductase [Nakamurella panacisegetis]
MSITLIASVAENGVIGDGGDLAWRNSEDLRRFKNLTTGHPIIMGRKTFDSIGRPLPGRRTIVVTRSTGFSRDGVEAVHSLPDALALVPDQDVFVIGGGEIYAQSIGLADRLEITHIELELAGDTRFPAIAPADWERIRVEHRDGFSFVTYRRRPEPVTDLTELLGALEPELHPGEYLYCSVEDVPLGIDPVVMVAESEGTTLVLPREQADQFGIAGVFPCAWITLKVPSALEAVGLTAAISTALTRDGISCNVIAGYHHDHLFVPADRAHDTLNALAALAHTRA